MSYQDRGIESVSVDSLQSGILDDGRYFVTAEIEFALNSLHPEDSRGPSARMGVGVFPQAGASLEVIEGQLLEAAHNLVQRLAAESQEDVKRAHQRCRDDRNLPDPLAELQSKLLK